MVTWAMSPLSVEPANPKAGQPVEVRANIYIADIPMSYIRAELIVNSKVADSKQLVLWFDDPQDFSFTFTPDKPGEYDVVVRANMLENETYFRDSGEDLSQYSSVRIIVS